MDLYLRHAYWYFEKEAATDALITFHADLPAVQCDNLFGNCKSQAKASSHEFVIYLTCLVQAIKNSGLIFVTDAAAVVRNAEDQVITVSVFFGS